VGAIRFIIVQAFLDGGPIGLRTAEKQLRFPVIPNAERRTEVLERAASRRERDPNCHEQNQHWFSHHDVPSQKETLRAFTIGPK
jgi:hypothetical protein